MPLFSASIEVTLYVFRFDRTKLRSIYSMVLKLLQIIGQIFAFDNRVPSSVTGGGAERGADRDTLMRT